MSKKSAVNYAVIQASGHFRGETSVERVFSNPNQALAYAKKGGRQVIRRADGLAYEVGEIVYADQIHQVHKVVTEANNPIKALQDDPNWRELIQQER